MECDSMHGNVSVLWSDWPGCRGDVSSAGQQLEELNLTHIEREKMR